MMKRIIAFISIIMILSLVTVACGNTSDSTTTKELETPSQTTQTQEEITDEDTTPTTIAEKIVQQFPFSDLEKQYQSGTKSWAYDAETFFDDFDVLRNEAADLFNGISDYLTSHAGDMILDKSMSEFDDYENEMSEWFDWCYKVIYTDSSAVPANFYNAMSDLQSVATKCDTAMKEAYELSGTAISDRISQMFTDINSDIEKLNADAPLREVYLGQTITADGFAEITLNSVSYESEIDPSDTSGAYTYRTPGTDGMIFLAINYTFCNLESSAGYNLDDYVSFSATYDGGYQYSGSSIGEEGNFLSNYPNLLPLADFKCWGLITVPEKLQGTSYKITMTFNGVNYIIIQ